MHGNELGRRLQLILKSMKHNRLVSVLGGWHRRGFLGGILMNTANAIGFLFLGTLMQVIALTAPASVVGSFGPEEARTLWLQFMGLITGAIGGGYLVREGSREMVAMLGRTWARRVEAREQVAQGAARRVPLGGVRVTF